MKKLFFSLLALLAVCSSAMAQEEPTDGGIYYLYNTESGNYLSRGSNWGTKAITQAVGMPWKVTVAEGAYKLQMYDLTVAGSTTGYGSNGYCDNGTPIAFTPAGDAATGYTLATGSNFLDKDGQLTATSTTWQFLTQTQYTAKLATMATSQESAIATAAGITLGDATLESIVGNTDNYKQATTDDGIPTNSTWPVAGVTSRGGVQNWATSYGGEIYEGGGRYTKTITGLKQGIYKVTVRAMKRVGTNANCYTMGGAGYPVSDAYLDANGYIIPIQSWYEGCTSDGAPNTTDAFMTQVNAGKYKASGYVYVGSDGTMDLKAISEAYWGKSWFLFDGIEYTFYSDEVSDDDITTLEATIPTTPYDATIASNIATAKATLDGAKTIANYNALSALIPSATASAKAYASAKATADAASAKATAAVVDVTTAYTAFTTAYTAGTLNGTTEADAVATAYTTALNTKLAECSNFTSKITNPSFEEGSLNGWTSTDGGGVASNGNFLSATGTYFVERWAWSATGLGNGSLTQTISNLPAGEYILTAEAQNLQQVDGSVTPGGFYITIGDKQVEVSNVAGTFAVSITTTAKGDLTIGTELTSCTGNWVCVDNFKLYFNGIDTQLLTDEIATATTQYSTYEATKDYAITLKSAIDAAQTKADGTFSKASEVNDAVSTLQAAEATAKAAYIKDHYAVLEDGKYVISTAGLFLGAGNSWGTQASLLAHPEYVTLAKLADGKYTIESQVSNGGDYKYFNGSYMDGAATEIAIITIDGKTYLSTADNTYCYNNSGIVGSHGDMDQEWTITSLADMDAKMADATEANPMDVTYKVLDPNFGRNNVNAGTAWERTNVTKGGDNANQLYEAYCKTFSMKQTITGLPAGTYELKATAMYRQDGSDETLPYMFANGVKTGFAVNTGGENTMATAATAMAAGSYEISAKVYIQDGSLRFGAATEGTSCWSIWDNVQLYYLGSAQVSGVENSEYKSMIIKAVDGETTYYGTFCAASDVTIPAGVTAYTVTGTEDDKATLKLSVVSTTIPASTPVIISGESAVSEDVFTLHGTGTCTTTGNILTGALAATDIESGYVLQYQTEDKYGFYQVSGTKTVPANRCYIAKDAVPGVKAFYFSADDAEADAIQAIEALTSGNAKIYDLNGRQLQKLQKGINIVNGHKVMVK